MVNIEKRKTGSDARGVKGRPHIGWMDTRKRTLDAREMFVWEEIMVMCDRDEWRASGLLN